MHSCIFEGSVSHCRFEPIEHRFQYRLYMLFLDLAEIPSLVGSRRLISDRPRHLFSFLARDHLSGQGDLDSELRSLVEQQTSVRPQGRICLLTQLRYFGYYFSPLNLFYVYSADDNQVESVVAEVNNTPWGERHCYVLWHGNQTDSKSLRYQHPKQLHVSPFMDMEMSYRWRIQQPSDHLSISLENTQEDRRLFAASLNLRRRELNRTQLRWMSLRYPLMTGQIIAAIHFQALKLWWKKCPVYHHPSKSKPLIQSPARHS
jgi:uncharacterized protein